MPENTDCRGNYGSAICPIGLFGFRSYDHSAYDKYGSPELLIRPNLPKIIGEFWKKKEKFEFFKKTFAFLKPLTLFGAPKALKCLFGAL